MKKLIYTLMILMASMGLQAQNAGNLKAVYNNKGVQTQLISFDSIINWGYDNEAKEVFVNLTDGTRLIFSANDFFQFEFVESGLFTKEIFKGRVQKGPYINGSSVTITELDENMYQTGNVFSVEITDNAGNFEKKNLEFASDIVELRADGYYFNEVRNQISTGPLTLYGLANIRNLDAANINIITHLERPRINYLIENENLSFAEAKEQARNEVLNVFAFTLPENIRSESLDITQSAILLAISSILQGSLSTGDMSELLANISSDIRTDGVLNNSVLGSRLINNAVYLDVNQIVDNMEQKYSGLGVVANVTAEDLNNLIQSFIENCGYTQNSFITYPKNGKHGLNILADDFIEAEGDPSFITRYSMKATLPGGNSGLKIILKSKDSDWGAFDPFSIENWSYTYYDWDTRSNTYHIIDNEKSSDLSVTFFDDCIVEFYENGATTPTKTKTIKVIVETFE